MNLKTAIVVAVALLLIVLMVPAHPAPSEPAHSIRTTSTMKKRTTSPSSKPNKGGRQRGLGRKYLEELCRKLPNAGTLTIAKKAYRERPEFWSNVESCRTSVRTIRGATGDRLRQRTADKSQYRVWDGRPAFPRIPKPILQNDGWGIVDVNIPGLWLVMSDVHIPWHDYGLVQLALQKAKKDRVVGILLNGDITDCFAVSRWETNPRLRDFPGELDMLREFLDALRRAFPKAEIIWKAGNHELRYNRYMMTKAPDLFGIDSFDFREVSHANQHGITYYDDNEPIRLGKLLTLHGHEYYAGFGLGPVQPARWLRLKANVCAMSGHWHRPSQDSDPDATDHLVTCWTTGCMCQLHPQHARLAKWTQGLAFVEVSKDGAFEVMNYRYRHGKLYA